MNKRIIFITLLSFIATCAIRPQESPEKAVATTATQTESWYDSLVQGWQNFVNSVKNAFGGSQVKEKVTEAAQKTKAVASDAAQTVKEKTAQLAQQAKETGEGALAKVKNFFSGKNSAAAEEKPVVQEAVKDVQEAQEQLKDKTQDLTTELQKLEEKVESASPPQ